MTVAKQQLVDQLQRGLVNQLRTTINLPGHWAAAMLAVLRHEFIPPVAWAVNPDGTYELLDQATAPERWLEAVYTDRSIVTQQTGATPTSSSSMPEQVARMAMALEPRPGHRVLEIGTGTGWNAALLAHAVGPHGRVVTMEIDHDVATRARASLTGCPVEVIEDDGERGWPAGAPYDRLIATCAVHTIPLAWLSQVRDGGRLVLPWQSPLGLGALLALDVEAGAGFGRFFGEATFMWSRPQAPHYPRPPAGFAAEAAYSQVEVDLAQLREPLARFVTGLAVHGCASPRWYADDELWLHAADSWACVDIDTGCARQAGRRRLWDEVQAAYRWWVDVGRPGLGRFGVTATAAGCLAVWLDEPGQTLPALACQ